MREGVVYPTISTQYSVDSRRSLSAANAHRHHAVTHLAAFHLLEECRGQFGPRTAERMSQRDGSAVHVDLLRIESKFAHYGQRLRRECFVELDPPDVIQF